MIIDNTFLDIGAILASLVTLMWKNYKEKVTFKMEQQFFCGIIIFPPQVIPLMEKYKILKPKPE